MSVLWHLLGDLITSPAVPTVLEPECPEQPAGSGEEGSSQEARGYVSRPASTVLGASVWENLICGFCLRQGLC